MLDEVAQQLLGRNPRAEVLRREVDAKYRRSAGPDTDRVCLDVLTDCLATLSVAFVQLRPSSTALVESILANDCFAVSVDIVIVLDERWSKSGQTLADQTACLEMLAELLSGIAAKSAQLRSSVSRELVAAFLVAAALQNAWRGDPVMRDVRDEVFRRHELYLALDATANLRDVVAETRRRFLSAPSTT